MQTTIIDSSTNWKSLPWDQIKEKIFIIQQRLYNYSKECNQKSINELQNYILNSSDLKIFAIQTVSNQIETYYFDCNQENYNFCDKDKFLIYKSLFKDHILYRECYFIREQIKQYLVYLCLKPEWESKFEPKYKFNFNTYKEYYSLYRFSRFLLKNKQHRLKYTENNYFISKIQNKCIDINYLIDKIQPIKSIFYYLQNWLSNKYILESLYKEIYVNNTINYLYKLLNQIIYHGIEWSNIISNYDYNYKIYHTNITNLNLIICAIGIKDNIINKYKRPYLNRQSLFSKYSLNYNMNKKLSISINLFVYTYLTKQVKKILYHKNKMHKWRPNSHLSIQSIINKIFYKLKIFCIFYYPLINQRNLVSILIDIENMIFRWVKKNKSNLTSLILYKKTKYLYL